MWIGSTVVLLVQLVAITAIDWKWHIIPNYLNATLMLSGLFNAYDGVWQTVLYSTVASFFVVLLFWILKMVYSNLRNQDGLGWGDVKFLGAAVAWVGLTGLPWVVLVAAISGLAFTIVSSVLGRPLGFAQRLAFGPHLALGLFSTWVLRDTLGSNI